MYNIDKFEISRTPNTGAAMPSFLSIEINAARAYSRMCFIMIITTALIVSKYRYAEVGEGATLIIPSDNAIVVLQFTLFTMTIATAALGAVMRSPLASITPLITVVLVNEILGDVHLLERAVPIAAVIVGLIALFATFRRHYMMAAAKRVTDSPPANMTAPRAMTPDDAIGK